MSDRRVHARYPGMEIVRYNRAGKWYLEPTDRSLKRQAVTIAEAVAAAKFGLEHGGGVFNGLCGGDRFDSLVQQEPPHLKRGRRVDALRASRDETGCEASVKNPSDRRVVGHFESRTDITLGREPEVGISWLAEAPAMGQGALGETPREAVTNLLRALDEKGISGQGNVDFEALDREYRQRVRDLQSPPERQPQSAPSRKKS